jgi:arsenite oxidase small subunit
MSACTRRRFLRQCGLALGSTAALAAKPARADCDAGVYREHHVARISALSEDEVLAFEYPAGHPCLLVYLRDPAAGGVGPGSQIVAYSAVCPHRGYRFGAEHVIAEHGAIGPCPWHNSGFDLCKGGAQVLGQSNRDLPRVVLEQRGDDLYAVGMAGTALSFTPPGDPG